MVKTKKVISIILCICMLMQLVTTAAFASSAGTTAAGYLHTLENKSAKAGDTVVYNSVDKTMTDTGLLRALSYNSDDYDENWFEREKSVIVFEKADTTDAERYVQETSPLKHIRNVDNGDEDGYNVEFKIPATITPGEYKVTIQLCIPEGKEADPLVRPITFVIKSLDVTTDSVIVTPVPGGSATGAIDPSKITLAYREAAKVCYDLGMIPDVYASYDKFVTKEKLAYTLVEFCGLTATAEKQKDVSRFSDLTSGTYLNGCANVLQDKGVLYGETGGVFAPNTEMKYEQIIKCIVDILGFSPMAQSYGAYPTGYITVANRYGIVKGVTNLVNGSPITYEQFARIVYNALLSKRMVIDSFSYDGYRYKEVDECQLYLIGYERYTGEVSISGNIATVVDGTLYSSDTTYGAMVLNKTLTIGKDDVKDLAGCDMVLFVKDGIIECGIKYYFANFIVNNGAIQVDQREISIDLNASGYTSYQIAGEEEQVIPDSKKVKYTLSEGCGKKSLSITFSDGDEYPATTIAKSITLKQKHTITYKVDDVVYATESVECGADIPELKSTPSKEGYAFEGWEDLPDTMPDGDITVTANFSAVEVEEPDEPEETEDVFVAELPNQEGVAGETIIIENLKDLIPEEMHFGLFYASDWYVDNIEKDAVYTFENDDVKNVYTYEPTPLTYIYGNDDYNLEIPIPEDLKTGTYTLTIELDIAKYKNSDDVKPFKFIIPEFYVENGDIGSGDGDEPGTTDPDNPGTTDPDNPGTTDPDEPGNNDPDEPGEEDTDIVFYVKDTTNLATVSGAQVIVTSQDGTVSKKLVSDSEGIASGSIPDGSYSVQVIASEYEMRNFVVEKTENQSEFTVYLNKNPLVKIETSVKEMTKQEMIDAGIDINAPENKHVYKCVTVLKFTPVSDGGSIDIIPIEVNFDYVCDDKGTIITAKPAYCDGKVIYPVAKDIYLIIHSEVTWLKEMFDVQLVVANTSAIETIQDCEINLNLPEGLSLAVMTEAQQSLKVNVAEIAPLATNDIHWYVCGDKEGEYLINGNIIGKRVGGGITEDLKASFTMQTPITVLAGNAMKLLIEAERYATVGQPYKVRYTLQNVSSKTLYDVALNVLGGKFRKAYSVEELIHNGDLVDLEGLSGTFNNGYPLEAEEFKSGDVLSGVFEIIFGTGIDPEHINYMVTQMFTFTGEGSTTTIPTEVVLVDSIKNHTFDEGTITLAPTCTTEGKKVFACTDNCDKTEEITLPKTDHILGDWIIRTESTCNQKGEKYKKCKNCSYEITAELLEGAHKWNDGEITTPSTETEEGIKTYTCTICSATKTEKMPKLIKQDVYFITGDTMNRVYNGSGETIYNKAENDSENGGAITYTSSNESVATVDNNGKLTILGVGETTITATAAATDIYAETSVSYVLTVTKAALTIKAKDVNVFYGEAAVPNGYEIIGLAGSDTASVIKGEASYSFDYVAFSSAGEYFISVSGLSADNYDITFENGKIIVAKAVSYAIELSDLTKRKGQEGSPVATLTPYDETAVIKIEYQIPSSGEWTETMPEDVGEYNIRASLSESSNIAIDASKYTLATYIIKAGAIISGTDGASVGIEIVENEDELEYIIPDAVIESIIESIPDTGEVVIDSSNTDNTVNNLVLPSNIIKAFGDSDKVDSLTIMADASEITMDKGVIGTLAESAQTDDKLKINIEVVSSDALTDRQLAAVNAIAPDATVLQLSIDIIHHDSDGNEVSTESIHQLNGNVDIRTAYELPDSMVNKRLVVCYVSDDGSTTYIRAQYADGFISFATDHFSHYVIAITDCTHTWDAGEVIVPSTTSSTGLKKFTCTICGGTKEEIIPKKSVISSGGGGGGSVTKYKITFETNGGNAIETIEAEKNTVITEPTAPAKEGYIFEGWYTDKELTQKYDFATKVTKKFTLYAKWSENKAEEKPEQIMTFKDISTESWYYDSVKYVYENGLMNGVSDSEFSPDAELTRAMFVTILYRLEKEPDVTDASFADVAKDSWYEKAVKWASANGIVNGITETEFAPDTSITREQMATIIYRYAKFKGYDISISGKTEYSDNADISDFAKDAIIWSNAKTIMNGNDDNTFAPKANSTRAQAAAVFMRIIENLK